MCESLRPGITVRPLASMILVLGPRSLKISRSLPIAVIFSSVMATASTNEGTPFVAILALYNIVSAGIEISLVHPLLFDALKGDADLSPETGQDDLLAASSFDRRDEVLVVPGIHRCPFDRFLVWKDRLYLRPDIPTETFRLYRS